MNFFKRLKAYSEEEIEGAYIGFGFIKAMNYDTEKKGHLLFFSVNFRNLKFIKKLFIPL